MSDIRLLAPTDDGEIRRLLEGNGLPVSDLGTARPELLGLVDPTGLIGVIGLEVHGRSGLLRSLAVHRDARGRGLGTVLVDAIERLAASRGVRRLFLLTDTAEVFFTRRGFARVDRGAAPAEIRGTSEFSTLCPSTSTLMVKEIPPRRYRVLILCTGNSARSQMAEAILSTRGGERFEAVSAGSKPAPRVNPWAERVLAEAGIPWGGRSPRGLEGLDREHWDFVITVCDRAKEACPIFPGTPVLAHWGMPDPAEVNGSDEEKLRAFRDTFVTLGRRIDLLLSLPLEKLDRLALESAVRAIGGPPAPPA